MENYYFDEHGVYTGSAPANVDTLPPENALRIPPPEQAGFWPVLSASRDSWELVEDHRGEQGWLEGQAVLIDWLGPLPENWSVTPPPDMAETEKAGLDMMFVETLASAIVSKMEPQTLGRYLLNSTGTAYHTLVCPRAITGSLKTLDAIAAARPDARPCPTCNPPTLPAVEAAVGE